LTIARVDLPTGTISRRVLDRAVLATGRGPGTSAGANPVASLAQVLGRWIAPTAAAKVWLEPALALSPDGSRLYLLAVNGKDITEVDSGSAGVIVLDSMSLGVLGHWPPAADLVSIATSTDGRLVYASGMARPGQPASVTVYDPETGRQVAFLGQLGEDWVMFGTPPR
jgi:hypothetical protein